MIVDWRIAVTSLSTYNSVFNITTKNNNIFYSSDNGLTWKTIIITPGAYEVSMIDLEIQRIMKINGDVGEVDEAFVKIITNDATSRAITEITNNYQVDFTQPGKNIGNF